MASSLAVDSLLEIMTDSAKQLGIGSLKEKQIDAISSLVQGMVLLYPCQQVMASQLYMQLFHIIIFDILRGELNDCLALKKIVLQQDYLGL